MPATAGLPGAAALASETADELVLGAVREVHRAVAGRAWALPDRLVAGARLSHRLHDAVADGVYGGIGAGLRGLARGLRALDETGVGPRLEDGSAGRFLLASVNGLIGDRLREEESGLAFDIAVRAAGADVALTESGLAAAFPAATDSVVIFVHGLCESEDAWWRAVRPRPVDADEPDPGSYGDRLAGEGGWTPVYLRVNTGLPVAENGVALAALLTRVVEAWPGGVRRLALVGHSMGGLIIRAAGAVAADPAPVWPELVTDVVTLGTPHLGAPLERLVARSTPLLGRLPEAAPVARILEYRSVGILDLRRGLAPDVRHFPHARYHLVAGSLTRSPRHPVALSVGDLLVQPRSALGRPRGGAEMFPGADALHVPGAGHFDLLNHRRVHAALSEWLARD